MIEINTRQRITINISGTRYVRDRYCQRFKIRKNDATFYELSRNTSSLYFELFLNPALKRAEWYIFHLFMFVSFEQIKFFKRVVSPWPLQVIQNINSNVINLLSDRLRSIFRVPWITFCILRNHIIFSWHL